MSSVMLKWSEPTYSLIGPVWPFGMRFGIELPIRFFSAWVGWTTIGIPNNFWPDNPRALKQRFIRKSGFKTLAEHRSMLLRCRVGKFFSQFHTHECYALGILELDIGDPLEPSRFVAGYESNVLYFANA